MDDLPPKMQQAAMLLGTGMLMKDVASKMGVARETLWAWKQLPFFQVEMNRVRREILDASMDALRELSVSAVGALGEILKSAKSEETRRKAAVDILQLVGFDDLERFYLQVGATELESNS
jgi:hypothetical protein